MNNKKNSAGHEDEVPILYVAVELKSNTSCLINDFPALRIVCGEQGSPSLTIHHRHLGDSF